jgi:hypothetical protein
MAGLLMNDELEKMFKKAAVAYFKVPSRHWLSGSEENQGKS